jgi:hypothetical protein
MQAEVFSELDPTSEHLKIQISPDKPYFRLSTDGDAGTSQVECPRDSDVVESFSCQQQLINRYRMSLLKPSEKALALSQKISIRMNRFGVLSIQYLVAAAAGTPPSPDHSQFPSFGPFLLFFVLFLCVFCYHTD